MTTMLKYLLSIPLLFLSTACLAENAKSHILQHIPLAGYAKHLAIPRGRPALLYVLVQDYAEFKPENKTGLYVFNIADVNHPEQLGYFPVVSPIGMETAEDGKSVYLYSAWFNSQDKNAWYGVRKLNLANPAQITEIWRRELDIAHAVLSEDEKMLLVRERSRRQRQPNGYQYSVFSLSDTNIPQPVNKVINPGTRVENFFTHPDGKHLLLNLGARKIQVHDISAPARPVISKTRHNFGFSSVRATSERLYTIENTDLVVRTGLPVLQESGRLKGKFSSGKIAHISTQHNLLYLPDIYKTVYIIDIHEADKPQVKQKFVMPEFIGDVIPTQDCKRVFVGMNEGIAVMDPAGTTH
ncbi:MAG: hypothetical protein OEZ39_14265 [Gammaproteobacteria bacterium]|nr:hypothetical protein [Gammaproteobacteria bacterium]MDH5653017.1 hypothetical protein [Gammaproteobacteria bacterium]